MTILVEQQTNKLEKRYQFKSNRNHVEGSVTETYRKNNVFADVGDQRMILSLTPSLFFLLSLHFVKKDTVCSFPPLESIRHSPIPFTNLPNFLPERLASYLNSLKRYITSKSVCGGQQNSQNQRHLSKMLILNVSSKMYLKHSTCLFISISFSFSFMHPIRWKTNRFLLIIGSNVQEVNIPRYDR